MGPSYNDSFGNSQVPGGGGSAGGAGMSGAGGATGGGGANAGASNVGVGAVGTENTVPVAGGSVPVGSVVGGVRITPRQETPEATSTTPQGMPVTKAEAVQPVQAPMQGAEATQPSGVPEANQQEPGIHVAAEASVAPVAPQQLETPMAAQQSEMSGVQQPAEVPAPQQPTGVAMAQGQVAQGQAMQETQQMPQQMPMASSTNLPVSSGKGDIILAPSGEKGKNKGLMIAGVVAVAIILAVGIGAMIGLGGGEKGSNGGAGAGSSTGALLRDDEKSMFNLLANLFVFNDKSDKNIDMEELMNSSSYAIEVFGTDSKYYEDLKYQTEAFSEKYLPKRDNDAQAAIVSLYYYYDLAMIRTMTEEEIVDIYLSSGKNEVLKRSERLFEDVESSSDAQRYVEAKRNMIDMMVSRLDWLNEAGCIVGGAIDSGCAEQVQDNWDYSGYLENQRVIYSIESDMKTMAVNSMISLYYNVYDIDNAEGTE